MKAISDLIGAFAGKLRDDHFPAPSQPGGPKPAAAEGGHAVGGRGVGSSGNTAKPEAAGALEGTAPPALPALDAIVRAVVPAIFEYPAADQAKRLREILERARYVSHQIPAEFVSRVMEKLDLRGLLSDSDRRQLAGLSERYRNISASISRVATAKSKELWQTQIAEIRRLAEEGNVGELFEMSVFTYEEFSRYREPKMRALKQLRRTLAPETASLAMKALVPFVAQIGALAAKERERQGTWCQSYGLPYSPNLAEIGLEALLVFHVRNIPSPDWASDPADVPILKLAASPR